MVALSYDQDVERWRQRHERGEVLDETPYGYHRAADRFDVAWTASHPERPLVRRARDSLSGRLGFDIVHIWRNRRLLRSADVIWTHTEREHLAVAFVLRGGAPPVIAQSVWLWDAWPGLSGARRRLIATLLRRHAVELVLSRVNLADARRGVPGRRVEFVPFGSAALPSVRSDPPGSPPLVLSVGNDSDRDWAVLARAAERLPGMRFRILSGSRAARGTDWPGSVEPVTTATRETLIASMREASCVVVPLRHNRHASGATSCIEALSAGRPLVVTRAGGIDAYVEGSATLVAAGDAAALADAIDAAVHGAGVSPREGVEVDRGLTQADYVERYARITLWLLGGPWDGAVSEFVTLTRAERDVP